MRLDLFACFRRAASRNISFANEQGLDPAVCSNGSRNPSSMATGAQSRHFVSRNHADLPIATTEKGVSGLWESSDEGPDQRDPLDRVDQQERQLSQGRAAEHAGGRGHPFQPLCE